YLAAGLIKVNLSMEGFFNLRRGAAENDRSASGGDLFHFHAVNLQPSGNLRSICFRDAKALAELFRREPLMIVRGLRIMLGIEQLEERILLRCVGLQGEEHPLHTKVRRHGASVILRNG